MSRLGGKRSFCARNLTQGVRISPDHWDIIGHLSFLYIKFTVSISKKDVEHVAHLARIRVAPDELTRYQEGLANILELVTQMQDCNTDGVEPMAHPQDIALRLREDCVTEINERSSFQKGAPLVEDGLYLVPRVIE
jgi:aspartyl-tRNA(Asn)/glutamyl-tRNA(Gln) amidotransferase subunit C